MRNDYNAKPELQSEHRDYFVVYDGHIPTVSKENIILKPSGIEIIARHYFQKYGVIIRVCPEFLKIDKLAEKIQHYLSSAKKAFPNAKKIGFIFISNDDPDDIFGHALPMIWEKNNNDEHLFFMDTTQYLGETVSHKLTVGVQAFRQTLLSLMPNLKLWSIFGCRQIDYSSCYTDALVMLKDGLRAPSFKAIIDTKIKESCSDITTFFAPEIVLRTAQVGSYPEKSHADRMRLIYESHRAAEKKPETLGEFRSQFDTPIEMHGAIKKFGAYTLFKAQQYAIDVERQKLAESLVASVLLPFQTAP
jgi:hypothetical protein